MSDRPKKMVNGKIVDVSDDDLAQMAADAAVYEERQLAKRAKKIDAERDRRTADRFFFDGHRYQLDEASQQKIIAAAVASTMVSPFSIAWIDADNESVTMDTTTMQSLAKAAFAWVSAHVIAGRALKDGDAADIEADAHWPEEGDG